MTNPIQKLVQIHTLAQKLGVTIPSEIPTTTPEGVRYNDGVELRVHKSSFHPDGISLHHPDGSDTYILPTGGGTIEKQAGVHGHSRINDHGYGAGWIDSFGDDVAHDDPVRAAHAERFGKYLKM